MYRTHTGPDLRHTPDADRTQAIIQAGVIRRTRQATREKAEQKRLADHTAPHLWVHAHINTRADFKSGYLAELVQTRAADVCGHFNEYLRESRAAYRATHSAN